MRKKIGGLENVFLKFISKCEQNFYIDIDDTFYIHKKNFVSTSIFILTLPYFFIFNIFCGSVGTPITCSSF